ncbi:MAG TPA: prephenate dehydrogenase, partial [Firmicutes bacterium]|nr:prephenate dehydrogenase [Bacillota bacterium]
MSQYRIGIIGLGLIGGSLGMALCRQPGNLRVVGYDSEPATGQEALARQGVHEIAVSLESVVRGADLVVVAVP